MLTIILREWESAEKRERAKSAISFLPNPVTDMSLCFDILEPVRHYCDESLLESLKYGDIDKRSFSRARQDGYLLRLRLDACKALLARLSNYLSHNVDFTPVWAKATQSWKRKATILAYTQGFAKRIFMKVN
jgi:CRISPR/Cas system-associated endonuclease Cas1